MGLETVTMALIRAYRVAISPFFPQTCRFHPSCSQYAMEAIQLHGVWKGGWLAIQRICRCHPLHPGGFDPVPPRESPPTGPVRWNREHSSQ